MPGKIRYIVHLSNGKLLSSDSKPMNKEAESEGRYTQWVEVTDLYFNTWKITPSHIVAIMEENQDLYGNQEDDSPQHTSG